MNEKKYVSAELTEFIDLIMRSDTSVFIPEHIAEVLEAKTKGQCFIYIQREEEGRRLKTPILWRYKDWYESNQRYEKEKKASHDRRVADFILKANIIKVSKALRKELLYSEEYATAQAYSLITNKKMMKIKFFGVEKLIEREDEL